MKKYTSVFGLFAKSSLLKILIISALMAFSQCLIFANDLKSELIHYEAGLTFANLENVIMGARISLLFGAAFILISVALCLPGTSFSSKTGYTLDRLSISPRAIFFCQAVYNLFVYVILWAIQLGICFGLCVYYVKKAPAELVGNQTVFLAFYRNSLLHALLPLADIWTWIRNAFLLIALSIATAEYPYKQRQKKLGFSAIAMVLFAVLFFKTEIVNSFNTILTVIVAIINIIEMLYVFFSEDNSYEG